MDVSRVSGRRDQEGGLRACRSWAISSSGNNINNQRTIIVAFLPLDPIAGAIGLSQSWSGYEEASRTMGEVGLAVAPVIGAQWPLSPIYPRRREILSLGSSKRWFDVPGAEGGVARAKDRITGATNDAGPGLTMARQDGWSALYSM